MHYFQFEIKEWIANTAHLTLEEECAYIRLILYYYDAEKPIDLAETSWVFRKCRIPDKLGDSILVEFFTRTDDGWVHKRCDEEIARYKAKQEQASKAGKASAERRFNSRSTDVQPIINQESLIINQESNKKTRTSSLAPKVAIPIGVDELVWNDFLTLRKSKKASLTATALKGIEREAGKAGLHLQDVLQMCCERGWIGFKAEWARDIPKQYNAPTSKNVSAARAIFGDERNLVNERAIDITPKKIT